MTTVTAQRSVLTALLVTLCVTPALASSVYSDSFQSGPAPGWWATDGDWSWTADGLRDGRGENRFFLEVLSGAAEYDVEVSASLVKGKGWGLFFGAGLGREDRVSGYTFQYDPGHRRGAYLLREWVDNHETVLLAVPASLDRDAFHDFRFEVSADGFRAFQDANLILSHDTPLNPSGDLVGLRTWGSSDAIFRDFSISEASDAAPVPEPSTAVLLVMGWALIVGQRR